MAESEAFLTGVHPGSFLRISGCPPTTASVPLAVVFPLFSVTLNPDPPPESPRGGRPCLTAPGPCEPSVENTASHLYRQGWDVVVITSIDSGRLTGDTRSGPGLRRTSTVWRRHAHG